MFNPENIYDDYLRTIHWDAKREEARSRSGNVCENCGLSGDKYLLECHHLSYSNKWNEKPEDLIMLCTKCHHLVHSQSISLSRSFGRFAQCIKKDICIQEKIQYESNHHLIRAIGYLNNGVIDAALKALKQAVKLEPENLKAHNLLKDLCIKQNLSELYEDEEQIIKRLIEKQNISKRATQSKDIFGIFIVFLLLGLLFLAAVFLKQP